uniref:Uncharacterized protein n=1 Tax=Candidatus Kentrum sp. FW TaxID=2126338 RepID=A0A450TY46_9GAMM|nr:MAG: hypothetical protein BECKFW1821C_GA0114237_10636 [Candidatus Kentron sp. FW]
MREQISSEEEAYRITFSRLLNMLHEFLLEIGDDGLLLIDSRSDLHSSVQDRRLVDVYRHWAREHDTRFIELPWFGFSAFYSGLQLADFSGYLLDFEQNEMVLEDALKVEFKSLYGKHEDSALIALLGTGDLREVRKFLEKAGCNRLRNLINKATIATLLGMIEKRTVNEGLKLLTNTERHREVIRLIDIFRERIVFSKIP